MAGLVTSHLAGGLDPASQHGIVGGNLLQRQPVRLFPRRVDALQPAGPGTGCGALGEQPGVEGINRNCAVLGTSASCIAAHPSDMCVALVAVDATVNISNANGRPLERIRGFLPAGRAIRRTFRARLGPDELITGIEVPVAAPRRPVVYLKVRDRTSYALR